MFNEIASLFHWHPMVSGMIVMAILNSLVTTMPTPKLTSSEFYVWAFNFLHAVVGSLSRIAAQYKQPDVAVTILPTEPPKI